MESNNLKEILIFTDWYYPGFKAGGPIQSVYNLANLLSLQTNVKVVTRNTDYGSATEYSEIKPNTWFTLSKNHQVMYLSKSNLGFKTIKSIIKESNDKVIIINGIFSFWFSILPLFFANITSISNIFISVRGMLHQSALSIKPTKKLMFLAFARGIDLYKKTTFLATSEHEKNEIYRYFSKSTIQIVPNIPMYPIHSIELDNKQWRSSDKSLRLLFLGRISPEKNPLTLLNALKNTPLKIHVHFVGSCIDSHYQQLFESSLKELPVNIHSKWTKEIPHHLLSQVFHDTDVMVMPSLGENFGHSIFESFAHAVPVIIGNNTPWKQIQEHHAGIEINPESTTELINAIQYFDSLSIEQYHLWKMGSHQLAMNYFNDNHFEEVYFKVLDLTLSTNK